MEGVESHFVHYRSQFSVAGGNGRRSGAISGGKRKLRPVLVLTTATDFWHQEVKIILQDGFRRYSAVWKFLCLLAIRAHYRWLRGLKCASRDAYDQMRGGGPVVGSLLGRGLPSRSSPSLDMTRLTPSILLRSLLV